MNKNFKGKSTKDIEAASETILNNPSFTENVSSRFRKDSKPSVTSQQLASDPFDSHMEKRKKRIHG